MTTNKMKKRIPRKEIMDFVDELTSKDFDKKQLFNMLSTDGIGGRVVFENGLMELDSALTPDALYLFINGVCSNTIYILCEEGLEQAIRDAVQIIISIEQSPTKKDWNDMFPNIFNQ